jgi:hypothetical protein
MTSLISRAWTPVVVEQMATNFADQMTLAWPNWAKIFFNNKGVACSCGLWCVSGHRQCRSACAAA